MNDSRNCAGQVMKKHDIKITIESTVKEKRRTHNMYINLHELGKVSADYWNFKKIMNALEEQIKSSIICFVLEELQTKLLLEREGQDVRHKENSQDV